MKNYISERHTGILINIMYVGLFVFIGGVFYLKDGGDMPRIFYFTVLIPSLLLMPSLVKEFDFHNRRYVLFVLFPIYLCLSFFWAADENIKKDFMFHLRNLFCVFLYSMGLWLVMRRKKRFINNLLLFLFFAGYFTSIVSLIHYFTEYGLTISKIMEGYFINNSNKIGSIYSIHICLSMFFLFYPPEVIGRKKTYILLITSIILSGMVVFLSQAVIPWVIIITFIVVIMIRRWYCSKILFFSLLAFSAGLGLIYFLGGFDSLMNMSRVQARIHLVQRAIEQMDGYYLFGIGLVYKLPLIIPPHMVTLPHPHNIFVDCFRFGGAVGLALVLGQCLILIKIGLKLIRDNIEIGFILFWFIAGIVVLSFYGQQPLIRPGGYLWFFYWTPGSLLLVRWIIDQEATQRDDL